jgi:hypothetical protein
MDNKYLCDNLEYLCIKHVKLMIDMDYYTSFEKGKVYTVIPIQYGDCFESLTVKDMRALKLKKLEEDF